MEPHALRQVDKTPALLEVHCRGHFDSYMLTMLHGMLRYWIVVIPVGCYIYKVYILALTQRLIAILTIVDIRGHKALLIEKTLTRISALTLIIAQGNNLNARDMCKAHHSPWATHTETHKAHAQRLDRFNGETHDMLLTLSALRSVNNDSAAIPMPCSS